MKQTAVEWLMQTLEQNNIIDLDVIDSDKYYTIIEQAKAMEKEQIFQAYYIGSNEGYDLAKIDEIEEGHYMKEPIEYYNETFKNTEG